MAKAWGGRFEGRTDPRVEKFTESISFDARLATVDVLLQSAREWGKSRANRSIHRAAPYCTPRVGPYRRERRSNRQGCAPRPAVSAGSRLILRHVGANSNWPLCDAAQREASLCLRLRHSTMRLMKRKMVRAFAYSVFYEQVPDGGYVASVPALPGCHTQGETLEETEFTAF